MGKSASEVLLNAADALDDFDLCRGEFALGASKAPKKPGDKLKIGHVYPWAKVHKLTAVSLYGVLCYVVGGPEVDAEVTHRLLAALPDPKPLSPYVWADQDHVTKADVQVVLRAAATHSPKEVDPEA